MSAIIQAMLAVQRDIHAVGIGKTRNNRDQGFSFRGIDDALAAFAPLLDQHGIVVIPSYRDLFVTARPTKSGGTTYNAVVQGTFTFKADDGTCEVVGPFYGEANDGQDKAVSKATSIAYRNALFIAFNVPHEPAIGGDPDGIDSDPDIDPVVAALLEAVAKASNGESLKSVKEQIKASDKLSAGDRTRVELAWVERKNELAAKS